MLLFCIQNISKTVKLCNDHRTGKGQFSFQSQRKAMPKNAQTIVQLHSSLMLVRSCLKSCTIGFSIMRTKNFQISKLGLEKAEEPEIKLPTFARSEKKQGNSRKTSTSVSSTMLKPLTVCIMTNFRKF